MSKTINRPLACPHCKTKIEWNENNPNRPFCSESCRNKDFIDWAHEDKKIAGDSNYDDVLSEDLY